jgi:hypothetical protein
MTPVRMSLHWTNQNAREHLHMAIRQIFSPSTFVCNFPLLLTMAPQQQLPPSAVQKELQRTVCIVGYEKVFEKDSMRKKQQEQVVYDEVHGKDAQSVSLIAQLLEGFGRFELVFNKDNDHRICEQGKIIHLLLLWS